MSSSLCIVLALLAAFSTADVPNELPEKLSDFLSAPKNESLPMLRAAPSLNCITAKDTKKTTAKQIVPMNQGGRAPLATATTLGPSTASMADRACGKPTKQPSDTPNLRIVNGATVPEGGMPWACAMVQNGRFQFCGCTVINNLWIATAGHCVADSTEADMKRSVTIFTGGLNLARIDKQNQRAISRVILHPQYEKRITNNDVALIKLAAPIAAFSSSLMPACLPRKAIDATAAQTGTKGRRICYVTGWGTLREGQNSGGGQIGSGSDQLLQAAIEMFSVSDCRSTVGQFNATTMICGGYDNGRFDSCQGDSGGPLVCNSGDGTWALNGIVSFGEGCARAGKPGVYTNVFAMVPWMEQTIAKN